MKNIKLQKYFFYISVIIIATSIIIPSFKLMSSKSPTASDGILDLSNWNVDSNRLIKLNGEWEFYYNQLLSPDNFINKYNTNKTIQEVPSIWSSYNDGKSNVPKQGFATYRLKILLPNKSESLGIKTLNIRSSARIFVNGKQILTCGSPGNSLVNTVHKNYADSAYFSADSRELEIIVQVANYKYCNSGIIQSISLGSQRAIIAFRVYNIFIDSVLISGMFFLSLYFLVLYLQRRSSMQLLYYGSYCLSLAFYSSTHSEKLINFAFPNIPYDVFTKMQTISLILMSYFLLKFVYYIFNVCISYRAIHLTDLLALIFLFLTVFTDFIFLPNIDVIFYILSIYIILTVLYILFKQMNKDDQGKYYIYTSIFSTLILFLINILNLTSSLEPNFFPPVFQPIFVLSFAFFMSEKYESAFETAESLSKRLQSLDKLKDDFLAKTSHELKTPLNGIINISQSLLAGAGGQLNSFQTEDMKLISSIGKRLSTLVNDILDYSKLKSMNITLNINCIDIHQVVESTVDVFRYLIKSKPLKIENLILPNTYFVLADENRLKQIVSNLLDNAIKFTNEGIITISCINKNNFTFITIKDTGVGIPKNKLKDIFISYEQLESNAEINSIGSGLGLSIAKQLVELHEGQVFAESEPGKGSSFSFSIPCGDRKKAKNTITPINTARAVQYPIIQSQNPLSVNVGGKFSILIVDDEYSNLKALLNTLTVWEYNVTAVDNAEAALQLLEGTLNYDLCILDVMMPVMSGYEACRKIREKYSQLELPVIMLTANATDIEAGFMAGANDFLDKPFEAGELKCRINTLVQLKKSKDLLLEKETAFLQAQIRPHFIFNAMNTVSSFCYTNPIKAGELLSELAIFLRSSFDFKSTSTYISIEKELRLVNAYVAIEKARFGKKLEVEYNIDPLVLKCSIPPLTIQPIVENSLRHGLMKRDSGGKITLTIAFQDGLVCVKVIDNGIGIDESILDDLKELNPESKGIGLTNIKRRLMTFYNTSLDISSDKVSGTTVSFKIPAEYY